MFKGWRLGLAVAGCVAVAAGVWQWKARPPLARTSAKQTADVPISIGASGEILGVGIGMSMEEARQKLDPLRAPGAYPPDEKELKGRRVYWKLAGTDFEWIMAWAKEGKITRIRGYYRVDRRKRFQEIGDVATAIGGSDAQTVRWTVERPGGTSYRMVAQGADEVATTVYMFALE